MTVQFLSPTPLDEFKRHLAGIFADVAQVSLASLVIPIFIDADRPILAVLGLANACAFWLLSLFTIKQST